jgi:hypothetical protein
MNFFSLFSRVKWKTVVIVATDPVRDIPKLEGLIIVDVLSLRCIEFRQQV